MTGIRGCNGRTSRRGTERYCAQEAIVWDDDNNGWCWYHNPDKPHRFGKGYRKGWVEEKQPEDDNKLT